MDDITGAQALAGAEVLVPEDELKPLAEDTFYQHELLGCRVVTLDGTEVGRVEDVQSAGGSDLLVVRTGKGTEVLIPCSSGICRRVDPGAGLIEIDPPDGLLDLNEI